MHVPASIRLLLPVLILTAVPASLSAAGPPPALDRSENPLAVATRSILQRHCLDCHNAPGRAKGGLSHITDLQQLVERGQVVPGKPLASPLYQRVHEGEMPPPGKRSRLTAVDGERLRAWIAARRPHASRGKSVLSETDALCLVRTDLEMLPARQRRFARYLTLGHLGGRSAAVRQTTRHALAKLVNSLSWHSRLTPPTAVDAGRLVYRLDLREYRWTARQWDKLAAVNPYRPAEPGPLARAVERLADCEQPLLRADWFIANASRPPAYHDFLQMPTTDKGLERLLQVDAPANIEDDNVVRAGFNGSGVARSNRLLERHDALHGAYWRSYDFSDNTGRQNLFEYPLGPAPGPAGFRHAGGEIVFHLPNGLQGYLLIDAGGRRIDRTPGEIVSDPNRPDKIVENGLSCIGCHVQGVLLKEDQVRTHVLKNPRAFTAEQRASILALYAPAERLRSLVKEDNDRFAAALKRLRVPAGEPEPVMAVVHDYEAVLNLQRAADEVGMTAEAMIDLLRRLPELARTLGSLAARGGSVQRQVFEEAYPRLLRELPAAEDSTRPVAPKVYQGHRGPVRALAWSGDGKTFASAGDDGTVRVWDVASGKQRQMSGSLDEPRALCFSPDGRRLLSGGADRIVTLWEVSTGRRLARLVGHTGGVRAVLFRSDGRQSLSAGEDRTIRIWDLERGMERKTLVGHGGTILALAISSRGNHVLSGGSDRTVRLWDLAGGKLLSRFDNAREVHAVGFSPDGKRILWAGADRAVTVRDLAGKGEAKRLAGHAGAVVSVVVTGDDSLLAASVHAEAGEHALRRWTLSTNRSQPTGMAGPVEAAAAARDGRALLASGGVIHLVGPARPSGRPAGPGASR